jgi:hypothetical protein
MKIYNNESRQSHINGWLISWINGIEFHHNKTTTYPGQGNTAFALVNNCTGTLDVHHNESSRFTFGNTVNSYTGAEWAADGDFNVENNNEDHYPAGFVQIRKNKVTGGARYAGPGGNGI